MIQCVACKQWYWSGQPHTCMNTGGEYNAYLPMNSGNELHEIKTTLERIAFTLERIERWQMNHAK